MKLAKFKQHLLEVTYPVFALESWTFVPSHYHITEIWLVTKQYIDCWGEMRHESVVSLQLWYADDRDHRLSAEKLLSIIEIFEQKITDADHAIEIEYQGETIGKYWVERNDGRFTLVSTYTDCLAKDACGIPEKPGKNSCCAGGCC